MIGGPDQHYGLCPFCGYDITRPGGTKGRAPATCGSVECKRAHNTQKRAVNRRQRSYKSRPLGGFGTLAWTRVHEYGDSIENEYGDTQRNGWEHYGRASRPFDFNTFDTHQNLGHTAIEQRPSQHLRDAKTAWAITEAELVKREVDAREASGEQGVSPLSLKEGGSDANPASAPQRLEGPMGRRARDQFEKEKIMAIENGNSCENLRVVVAAVDPASREVEEVILPVVSITRNEDGTPRDIWADVDDGQAINIPKWAWRYCLISLDFDDATLMEILTLWHREIDKEMTGVDDLTQLGLNIENLVQSDDRKSTSVEDAGAAYA